MADQQALPDYSYDQDLCAEFYDRMVEDAFGGIHSHDMDVFLAAFKHALTQLDSADADRHAPLTVVDVGCGTGRLTLALLHAMATAGDGAAAGPLARRVVIWGIDNSRAMLRRAELHAAALLALHSSLRARVTLHWHLGSFQDWGAPEGLAPASVDLVATCAGGLHHVASAAQLGSSLGEVGRYLASRRGALAVLAWLPWSHLTREEATTTAATAAATAVATAVAAVPACAGEPVAAGASREPSSANTAASSASTARETVVSEACFVVGPYTRTRLKHSVQRGDDGSVLVYERFRLVKACQPGERAAAGSAGNDGAGSGAGGQRGDGCGAAAAVWGRDAGAGMNSVEEEWVLRRIDRQELLELAHAAGLVGATGLGELVLGKADSDTEYAVLVRGTTSKPS